MTQTLVTPANKQEWLTLRSKNINSTESCALLCKSPYHSIYGLWHDKRDGLVTEIDDNERMECGRFLEAGIAALAAHRIGAECRHVTEYAYDDDKMGSSFDYQVIGGQYDGWLIECKNVDYLVHRDNWLEDEAPEHIEFQVQHQMEVLDVPGAIIAALVGGNTLKLLFRPRNKAIGSLLRLKTKQFWQSIEQGDKPEPDFEKDVEYIKSMYIRHEGKVIQANSHMVNLIESYKSATEVEKDLKKQKNAAKGEILHLAHGAEKITFDEGYVKIGKQFRVY